MMMSFDIDTLVTLAVGAQAFLAVLIVWYGLMVRDGKSKRIKAIQARQQVLQKQTLSAKRHGTKRPKLMSVINRFIEKLNVLRSQEADRVSDQLAQAGIRTQEALTLYFFMRLALPFIFGGMAVIWLYVLKMSDLTDMGRLLVSVCAVFAGTFAPKIYITNAAQKRRQALQKGLPDALDLLVVCTEAGLSLDMGLKRVSSEMMGAYPEIAEELSLTALELGFLPNRSDALTNLNKRTDLAALRAVVSTLHQTERYGTPLAQSLRVLSNEFRTERMLKAEEKAAKLPATLTLPMIAFIMPALFIVLLGPSIIEAMDIFPSF